MTNNALDFTGKMALLTGAASGMGLATAQAFAEAGAAVVLADFREAAVIAEAEKLAAAGHKVIAVRCDVSHGEVEAMVNRTVAELGRLDAAFNNAGVMARIVPTADSTGVGPRHRNQLARCLELYEVRIAPDAAPGHGRDRQQRLGRCVNRQPRHRLVYRIQARCGGTDPDGRSGVPQTGIRVNAINPGLIDTQIARDVVSGNEEAYNDIAKNVPIGRAGRPEEIASAVLWLCSPGASYVVGHALTVDGGMTVV